MPSPTGATALIHSHDTVRPSYTSRRPLFLLLIVAALLALVIRNREPLSVPMPEYLADARQWSPNTGMSFGGITDTFTPLAYPLFIAPALHLAGPQAITTLQAALYLATVAVAFLLLTQLGVSPRLAALGSLPILFYPEFFESITKIWDVGLSAFLFLLLAYACLYLQRHGTNPKRAILLGIIFAAGLFCRPNFAVLAPVLLYALLTSRPRPKTPKILATLGVTTLTTILLYSLLGIAAHGKPFLPTNGPYNLYVGNNPYAAQAFLQKLNGEPSLYPSMRAQHPNLTPEDAGPDFFHQAALSPLYTHDATTYITHHLAEDLRLTAIKLLTFFRPDTKVHSLHTKAGLFKALLALPALFFLAALIPLGRPPLTPADYLLLLIDAAYILPFLLTNADPRFRTSLDALLVLHLVRLLSLRFGTHPSLVEPRKCDTLPLSSP